MRKFLPLILVSLSFIACSIPAFYLDIHYPFEIKVGETLPLDIFITNARLASVLHIESICLTGELASLSQAVPGRTGLYRKQDIGGDFIAEPNRQLLQFETGMFSLTIKPMRQGVLTGTLIIIVDGRQINRDILVEVK